MTLPQLHVTRCAICRTFGNAVELYPAALRDEAFSPAVFSARRLPDRLHYRMVRCGSCGLVRSDPIASTALTHELYQRASFDYESETAGLAATYGRYLSALDGYGATKEALLEVGCGDGFFLEEALRRGYASVSGVEPTVPAVRRARPGLREHIICDVMRPGIFAPESFDVICLFQVLDHLVDPVAVLDECFACLKPCGLVLALNHNIDALSARLLKERSPIIDVEHTYLYSPATMARMFRERGFEVHRVGAVTNRLTLRYLVHLFPIPSSIKRAALRWIGETPLGRLPLSLPLGNLYLIAAKPPHPEGDLETRRAAFAATPAGPARSRS